MTDFAKRALHRLAIVGERIFDRFLNRTGEDRLIEAYAGYATPDHLIVRGRVLTALRRHQPKPTQSKLTNLRQMVSLFLTDEVADVTVICGQHSARTDEEGYFQILIQRDGQTGWVEKPVTIEGHKGATNCPVLVPDPCAELIVVSDIDDTVMETGAYSLARNLWTSMTGNTLSRRVFPDSIALIDTLSDNGRNPVFYVSSSPWNLFDFLTQIFDRSAMVRGPMFLRDLGISKTQFGGGTHGDHKGASIDAILAALPDVPAVLIGDTGQHDAEIYVAAAKRHPGRIKAIALRQAGPALDVAALEASGIPYFSGLNFDGVAAEVLAL